MTLEAADSLDAADRLGTVLAVCIEAVDHGDADAETVVARYSGQQWAPRFREVLLEARDTGPIR